ncbi:MAG TPA: hypothetical protein VGU71_09065 [Candidatus Dormibacteraeota bacterium]|nr:hypothetical protein [Candidatus Dormibacteraeota bacterium]
MIEEPADQIGPALELPAPIVSVPSRGVRAPIFTRHRVWVAALAACLLVTGGGLVLLYNDDTGYQNLDRSLTNQNESLTGRNLLLQGQLTATQTSLTDANAQLATVTAELKHPHLGIWNVPQSVMGPTYYLAAGVPDTFTYHLHLTSNGPTNVSIISFEQFRAALMCVWNGVANTNYCMHHNGSAIGWVEQTSISYDFHEAEGCAAYMLVITTPTAVTVSPDVSVTYNPAAHATGVC